MPVSRGHALALSAALHTAGLGVAGWASHGQYREPATSVAPQPARAYTLTFLTLAPPKPRPVPPPRVSPAVVRALREVSRPAQREPRSSGPSPDEPPRAAAALQAAPSLGAAAASPLRVRELAPGATAAAIPVLPPQGESAPESARAPRGSYQAATLVTPAGSACPDLPVSPEWRGRAVAVAVAFVVDAEGRVDASRVQIVESPGKQPTARGFYPRIYVVGTKAGRARVQVEPAQYDALVTHAVTSHILTLRFRPAAVGGRPVSSTVLVACHRYPGD